jgi:hypothetical protein
MLSPDQELVAMAGATGGTSTAKADEPLAPASGGDNGLDTLPWLRLSRRTLAALVVGLVAALVTVVVAWIISSSVSARRAAAAPAGAGPSAGMSVPALEPSVRGLYLWKEAPCLLPPPGTSAWAHAAACHTAGGVSAYRARLLERLRRPWNGTAPAFTRVFLSMTPAILSTRPADVRTLLAALHGVGVAVEFLAGEPTWLLSDEDVANGVGVCTAVAAYQRGTARASERFDGVHLDIEPHVLAAWADPAAAANGTDGFNDAYETRLLALLRMCRPHVNAAGARLAWAMPGWYIPLATDLWGPLLAAPFVDHVAVLHYTDNATTWLHGNAAGAGGVLPLLGAAQGRVPLVFVAEVEPPPAVPASITFWSNQGAGTLEAALALASARAGGRPGFAGVAIHHAMPFYALPPASAPFPTPSCVCTPVPVAAAAGGAAAVHVTITLARPDAASVALYGPAPTLDGLPVLLQWASLNATAVLAGLVAWTLLPSPTGGTPGAVPAPGTALEVRVVDAPNLALVAPTSIVTQAACTWVDEGP